MVIYKSPLGVAAYIFMSFWPRGQAVKTSPFHGGNTGSIPVGVRLYADVAQLAEQLICNHALPAIDIVNLLKLSHIGL